MTSTGVPPRVDVFRGARAYTCADLHNENRETRQVTMYSSQFQRLMISTLVALALSACGSDGKDGTPNRNGTGGSSALVDVSSEPAGANCASGGQRIDYGQDTNRNNVLDAGEVTGTRYACTDGSSALVDITPEPAGANCAHGGNRVDHGQDANSNAVLDASEITGTQYVCNGAPPVTYTIGGTVTGLTGSLVLQNNSDVFLTMSASGSFTFGPRVVSGDDYAVSVQTQPPGQTCTVSNGSGDATANVTDVQVTCTTHPLTLVNITPAADATDVDRTASLSMEFSAALDAAKVVPANVTLTSAGGDQPIALSVSGTQLTAVPTRQLLPATTYTLQASTNVEGIHGEQLAAAASGSFTTQDGRWGTAVLAETNDAGTAQNPQIAVDANGNAIVVWQQSDGTRNNIWANRYTPDSGWGTAVLIENNDASNAITPHVAMDADGNALAVWEQFSGPYPSVWANRYTAGLGWATPTLIETNNLEWIVNPRVAFDAAGNAMAVWEQGNGSPFRVWSNRYTAELGWGTPTLAETHETPAGVTFKSLRLVMSPNGSAVAVWLEPSESWLSPWTNRYTVGAGWGTPIVLEDDTGTAQSLDVAMNANGNVVTVWYQQEGTRNNIWSNVSTPDGRWGTATLVETEDSEAWYPRIAMDAQGNALAVWQQHQGTHFTIRANRYTPEDGWGTASVIQSDVTQAAASPQIVVDAAGNALAVWHQSGTLWSNRYTNDGGWGTAAPIDPDQAADATLGTIAIDASGNALATWGQVDGAHEDIYVNRFD